MQAVQGDAASPGAAGRLGEYRSRGDGRRFEGGQADQVVPPACTPTSNRGGGVPLGSHSAGERGAPGPGPGPVGGTSPAIKRRRGRDGTDRGSQRRGRCWCGGCNGSLEPLIPPSVPSLSPPTPAAAMPNFSGNWKMKSSENFEELLKALGEWSPTLPPLPPGLPRAGGGAGGAGGLLPISPPNSLPVRVSRCPEPPCAGGIPLLPLLTTLSWLVPH